MSAGERIARAVPVVARGWWQDPTDPPRGVAVALEAAGMLADPTPAEVERRVREQVAREIEAVVMRSAACPGERDGRCLGLMAAARIARGLPGLPVECGTEQPPSTASSPVPPADATTWGGPRYVEAPTVSRLDPGEDADAMRMHADPAGGA